MTKEQLEILNITQEVFRGVVMSIGATNPEKLAELSASLQAFGQAPGISAQAKQMLEDLAKGPGFVATAGKPRQ